MPTYVYKFTETGETIEVQQSFSEPSLTEIAHPKDGVVRPVKKVFQPVGVTFKGSGFYKTDSRGSSSSSSGSSSSGSTSTSSDSASSSSTSGTESSSSTASPAPASSSSSPSTSTGGSSSTSTSTS